jgi:hypothetical protein
MSNAIASAFFLAVLIVPLGGCDIGTTPGPTETAATGALLPPQARYQVDRARNRVWFLSHEGVFLFERSSPGRVALPLPGWMWTGEPYSCLPDLALGPRGEAVITSDVLPTLWRVDPDTLEVSVHRLALDADDDKDVGFSGLVYSHEHGAFFAASYSHGSLWRIDPRLATAQKVTLSTAIREACGLALHALSVKPRSGKLTGLCVRTAREGWTVDFASDGRSAHVEAASCGERAL